MYVCAYNATIAIKKISWIYQFVICIFVCIYMFLSVSVYYTLINKYQIESLFIIHFFTEREYEKKEKKQN
jgi:hypothetical protein